MHQDGGTQRHLGIHGAKRWHDWRLRTPGSSLLVLETWQDTCQHARWQAYIDNHGVFYSIINASCKAPDINLFVGKCWKSLHSPSIDVTAFRVESNANIGDAGARIAEEDELHNFNYLHAKFVDPDYLCFSTPSGRRPRTQSANFETSFFRINALRCLLRTDHYVVCSKPDGTNRQFQSTVVECA